MFDQCDDDGVEYLVFFGCGFVIGQLQECQIVQVYMVQDFVGQVQFLYVDFVGGVLGDVGGQFVFVFFYQIGFYEKMFVDILSGVNCDLSVGIVCLVILLVVQLLLEWIECIGWGWLNRKILLLCIVKICLLIFLVLLDIRKQVIGVILVGVICFSFLIWVICFGVLVLIDEIIWFQVKGVMQFECMF